MFIELTDRGNNRLCLPLSRIVVAENGPATNVYFEDRCFEVVEKYDVICEAIEKGQRRLAGLPTETIPGTPIIR